LKEIFWGIPKKTTARVVEFGKFEVIMEFEHKGFLIPRNVMRKVSYSEFPFYFEDVPPS
jgi:hypothetical protein